jgi:predicted PurR-regulated permease PerM
MTDPADSARPEETTRSRIDLRTIALVGLLVLFVLFTLRAARSFLVPIAVALLLDFLLSPVIRNLKRLKIPESIGAALVVFGLVGVAGVSLYALAGPAAKWLDRAPTSMAMVETRLKRLLRPLAKIQETAEAVEEVTSAPSSPSDKSVQIASPTLFQRVSGGTAAFLSTAVTVIFLTYFLLASGDLFMQKVVAILPVLSDKKKAVGITREIEAHISRYLSTSTVINLGMGLITWVALALAGMPNAVLWGAVAGLLNYVPYVGAIVTTAVIGMAALLSFESTTKALLMPAIYFGLNMVESNLVTPMILGRHMPLNPVALFVGLLLWWYLWGIPGAILAVPMMVSLKIFCDYIEPLRPVGSFLGP